MRRPDSSRAVEPWSSSSRIILVVHGVAQSV
jgi:hypothetical protein